MNRVMNNQHWNLSPLNFAQNDKGQCIIKGQCMWNYLNNFPERQKEKIDDFKLW